MKKKTVAFLLALTLILGLGVGALAASSSETISAQLDRGLKVFFNGQEQAMTTAAGAPVYPIVYNNTVYLPVRAVSGMFNQPIEFDAKAWTVSIGAMEKQAAALTSLESTPASYGSSSTIIRDAEELKIATADGLQTYSTGIKWNIWNGGGSADPNYCMKFNIKGYSEITLSAWSDVDAKVLVYDQNGEVFTTFEVAANSVVAKTLTLDAAMTQISFAANGPTGSKGTMKILDATVK